MKIKDIKTAIKFLEEEAGINVEVITHKYEVFDSDFNGRIKTDEELIDYANEQMENMKDE